MNNIGRELPVPMRCQSASIGGTVAVSTSQSADNIGAPRPDHGDERKGVDHGAGGHGSGGMAVLAMTAIVMWSAMR